MTKKLCKNTNTILRTMVSIVKIIVVTIIIIDIILFYAYYVYDNSIIIMYV